MKRLPSFATLFLLAVAGFFLYFVTIGWSSQHLLERSFTHNSVGILMIAGLAVMVLAPLLIVLKFFMRLDSKA